MEKKCRVVSRAVELVGLVKNSVGGRSFCTSDIMSACPTSARTLSTHPYEVLPTVATSSLNCTPPLRPSPERHCDSYDCVVKSHRKAEPACVPRTICTRHLKHPLIWQIRQYPNEPRAPLHVHVQCIDAQAVLPQFANVTALTSVSQEHYDFEAVLPECR